MTTESRVNKKAGHLETKYLRFFNSGVCIMPELKKNKNIVQKHNVYFQAVCFKNRSIPT
jgi:hypothetical protein